MDPSIGRKYDNRMKSQRTPKRNPKLFESVPMYTVPVATLFDEEGKLKLKGVDLSVYLYCCRLANVHWSSGAGAGSFMFRIEDVTANTGWEERAVWYALSCAARIGGAEGWKPCVTRKKEIDRTH